MTDCKLYVDFHTSPGPLSLGSKWPQKSTPSIRLPPRPLCPPNRLIGVKDYETVYHVPWQLAPTLKTPSSNALYSHHVTINPHPKCSYIMEDTLDEHLTWFRQFVTNLQGKFAFHRLLAVYENDNKKTHFHILVKTKDIRLFTTIANLYFAGDRTTNKYNYAVCVKPITISKHGAELLSKLTAKDKKALLNGEVNYIQNTYFTKEEHNKTHFFCMSSYKNL